MLKIVNGTFYYKPSILWGTPICSTHTHTHIYIYIITIIIICIPHMDTFHRKPPYIFPSRIHPVPDDSSQQEPHGQHLHQSRQPCPKLAGHLGPWCPWFPWCPWPWPKNLGSSKQLERTPWDLLGPTGQPLNSGKSLRADHVKSCQIKMKDETSP